MNNNTLLHKIALTKIPRLGIATMHKLLRLTGSVDEIFNLSTKELTQGCKLNTDIAIRLQSKELLEEAEQELNFIEKKSIVPLFYSDDNYPQRLKQCEDAPILLYSRGNIDFERPKVISIVGTRNATTYGNEFCDDFIKKLSEKYANDCLIVSGLAYGIDIQAHKSALKYGVQTIGVLAHGLDRIYPNLHRSTAISMLDNGGLLTEFPSGTNPDRHNFVMRNRIVAGMCDAIIVVESNAKGGALITAQLGSSYCKDVFAVPGRLTDQRSDGCNALIAKHQADLLLSFDHFIKQMNWGQEGKEKRAIQQELFIQLDPEEKPLYNLLTDKGALHIDLIARELETETYNLLSLLLQMEMKGIIKSLPGNTYSI